MVNQMTLHCRGFIPGNLIRRGEDEVVRVDLNHSPGPFVLHLAGIVGNRGPLAFDLWVGDRDGGQQALGIRVQGVVINFIGTGQFHQAAVPLRPGPAQRSLH